MMISDSVLGIDPGSFYTGYGIVRLEHQRFVAIDYGTIRLAKNIPLPDRLGFIYRELEALISRTKPAGVAVEDVFLARNAKSALQLGQARGVAILAAVNSGIPVFSYSALEVKQAVVGYGRATKEQVNAMVRRLLSIRELVDSHASDAMALAICHINSLRFKRFEVQP
ncbi:MAG: crossover junction endodeoxyribonuclease RuvC [Syntrophobacterales bacterium]|nr:crossover junction endodeoxyribonuclease RuvC [Syntrophobacterales bacterium]